MYNIETLTDIRNRMHRCENSARVAQHIGTNTAEEGGYSTYINVADAYLRYSEALYECKRFADRYNLKPEDVDWGIINLHMIQSGTYLSVNNTIVSIIL